MLKNFTWILIVFILANCSIEKKYHLKGYNFTKRKYTKVHFNKSAKNHAAIGSYKLNKSLNSRTNDFFTKTKNEKNNIVNIHESINDHKTNAIPNVSQDKEINCAFEEVNTNPFQSNLASNHLENQKSVNNGELKHIKETPKKENINPSVKKLPLWKQALIALSVLILLIGLYIALVFSEIFAFGN
jgi:preprotein translocase subunit SecF